MWSQIVTELSETSAGERVRSIETFQIPEVDGEGFSFLSAKFWLSLLGSAARRNKLISKSFKSDTDSLDSQSKGLATDVISNPNEKRRDVAGSPQVEHRDFPVPARELSRAAVSHILNKWSRYISAFYKRVNKITGRSSKLWVSNIRALSCGYYDVINIIIFLLVFLWNMMFFLVIFSICSQCGLWIGGI